MTVHRASDRSSVPQRNQCLPSHFAASLEAQEKADCTLMLWSIDSSQNGASADQYRLTVSRAQVSTHRGRVFFEVIRCKVTSFQMNVGSSVFFFKFVWNMLWLCHYGPALLIFWFQTDPERENSASYLKLQAGKTFPYYDHALVTLYVQFYVLIVQDLTGEFKRKIYVASWNLFTLAGEAGRVLCQLVMFLTVFFHWM